MWMSSMFYYELLVCAMHYVNIWHPITSVRHSSLTVWNRGVYYCTLVIVSNFLLKEHIAFLISLLPTQVRSRWRKIAHVVWAMRPRHHHRLRWNGKGQSVGHSSLPKKSLCISKKKGDQGSDQKAKNRSLPKEEDLEKSERRLHRRLRRKDQEAGQEMQ